METIIYQGQPITVETVNYANGSMQVGTDSLFDGAEDILRTIGGEYFLRRTGRDFDYETREWIETILVHRISLKAAILWATVRANGDTKDLRRDALAALQAPRVSNATRQYADGSMDIALRLKPGPARLVRAACELEEDTALGIAYWALQSYVLGQLNGGGRAELAKMENIFADNAPEEDGGLPENDTAGHHVGTSLDPFHADLFEAFTSRWSIAPEVVVRAVLNEWLQETFRTHEKEYWAARNLRENGTLDGSLLEPELSEGLMFKLLANASVDLDKHLPKLSALRRQMFPEANADTGKVSPRVPASPAQGTADDDSDADDEEDINAAVERMRTVLGDDPAQTPLGRYGAHDPEDVALLAAAAPEPMQEESAAGSLPDLVARRDAILKAMADQDEQESDEAYNARLNELNHLNRRIQALESGKEVV